MKPTPEEAYMLAQVAYTRTYEVTIRSLNDPRLGPSPHAGRTLTSSQLSKGKRVVVQVVLHVTSLEPRLTDRPQGCIDGRGAQDVGSANPPIRGAIEHVCLKTDVMHLVARREAEAHARRLPCAVVCALDNARRRQ